MGKTVGVILITQPVRPIGLNGADAASFKTCNNTFTRLKNGPGQHQMLNMRVEQDTHFVFQQKRLPEEGRGLYVESLNCWTIYKHSQNFMKTSDSREEL